MVELFGPPYPLHRSECNGRLQRSILLNLHCTLCSQSFKRLGTTQAGTDIKKFYRRVYGQICGFSEWFIHFYDRDASTTKSAMTLGVDDGLSRQLFPVVCRLRAKVRPVL